MTVANEEILRAWAETAQYWESHRDTLYLMFEPITRAMLEEVPVREGDSVLDVAAGVGEPALTIAPLVGNSGSVTCTDAVAEMVQAAEREARRRAITNIEFHQCGADSLPFADRRFDAAFCRLGAFFFPDPDRGLREMLRVLKPGGRLCFAVWHVKEANPCLYLVSEVASRYVPSAPEDPQAPGPFRFAQRGVLADLLARAGAVNARERLLKFRLEAPLSLDEFWQMRAVTSDTLRKKLAVLSQEQLGQLAEEVKETVRDFFPHGTMSFPAEVLIVSGQRP